MFFLLLKYIWCTTLLHCNTAYTSSSLYDNARCVLWTQFTAVYSSVEAVWWLIHFQYAMNCPFLCSVKFCWVEWDHIEHFTGITQHIKGDTERVSFQSELKMYKRKPCFASKFFYFARFSLWILLRFDSYLIGNWFVSKLDLLVRICMSLELKE